MRRVAQGCNVMKELLTKAAIGKIFRSTNPNSLGELIEIYSCNDFLVAKNLKTGEYFIPKNDGSWEVVSEKKNKGNGAKYGLSR